MISLTIPLGPACAALLVAALSATTLAQSPEPSPSADPGPLRMHDARYSHTATPLPDGSVLIVGGTDGWIALESAEVFDPASQRFRTVGPLGEPRYGHRATALPDGRVLITGGALHHPAFLSSVELYDPATETFSRVGRLKEPRFSHAATLLDDGRVLITGGLGKGKRSRPKSSAELFDPATGKSTSVGEMHKARMGHAATQLEDGRVAIIGGFWSGRWGERTFEVYDPQRQRFLRARKLAVPPNLHEAPRLLDGRVFLTAASGGAILIAPDAKSSELLAGRPHAGGRVTATLLDDGRVVVIGSLGRGSHHHDLARVDVFDPTTDMFQSADPMRQAREEHAAVRLSDGTVLVVGGILSGPGCMQMLDTAEIWDPTEMASIAGDTEVECVPAEIPTVPTLPSLGAETSGGLIEMPGSAFAITIPEDWTVKIADPDTDLFTAKPGSAWEALQAASRDRGMACSVAIGVAEVSLREGSGTGQGDVTKPFWDPKDPHMLWVPEPDIPKPKSFHQTSWDRLQHQDGELEHDVQYSLLCVANDARIRNPGRTFRRLMNSFEFLPR